jgi:hypothetical protein
MSCRTSRSTPGAVSEVVHSTYHPFTAGPTSVTPRIGVSIQFPSIAQRPKKGLKRESSGESSRRTLTRTPEAFCAPTAAGQSVIAPTSALTSVGRVSGEPRRRHPPE